MATLAVCLWSALAIGLVLELLTFLFFDRDFSGNDGGADERVWR